MADNVREILELFCDVLWMFVCINDHQWMLTALYGEDNTHDFIEIVDVYDEHLCQIKGVSSPAFIVLFCFHCICKQGVMPSNCRT